MTKRERNRIYKKALPSMIVRKQSISSRPQGDCICPAIRYNSNVKSNGEVTEKFIEFTLFKPEKTDFLDRWFGDQGNQKNQEVRETVLLFCIEMTN